VQAYVNSMNIRPNDPDVHYNLGRLYNDLGRKREDMTSLLLALALKPDFGAALTNLGVIFVGLEMRDEAIAVYEKLIEIDHTPEAARHILNSLKEKTTEAAPIAYVKELYDEFAPHFEERLVNDLCYRVPEKCIEFLKQLDGQGRTYAAMLDLGCGTGLCGQAFRDVVGAIIGVDLSAAMIEKARLKNIYERLVEDEIITFLEQSAATYELIVAGDVLIYMGKLDQVFRLLPACLARQGRIIFTTEQLDGDSFTLRPSGRYAHSRSYIRGLARENGLRVLEVKTDTLRQENGQWIMGEIYIVGHGNGRQGRESNPTGRPN